MLVDDVFEEFMDDFVSWNLIEVVFVEGIGRVVGIFVYEEIGKWLVFVVVFDVLMDELFFWYLFDVIVYRVLLGVENL